MATFDLESYATVQERIAQFYQDFPDGSIRTFMIVRDGPEVIFEARVHRNPEEAAMGVYTSGFARELEGKSPVNKTSHLENCESSAIGRALANLGYATDARRPSRSEMVKVARTEQQHAADLDFIREIGKEVSEEAMIGESNLRAFVREHWNEIKERPTLARSVVTAIEKATGHQMSEIAA